jgi:hypothetical protein
VVLLAAPSHTLSARHLYALHPPQLLLPTPTRTRQVSGCRLTQILKMNQGQKLRPIEGGGC